MASVARFALFALAALAVTEAVKVGDTIPSALVQSGFPPEEFDMAKRIAGKKVILMGLPGAFTPT